MSYTLSEAVHVAIVLDGQAQEFDYPAGDVELPDAVAELLVSQGFATPAVAASKKSKSTDPTTTEA
jgi:hypothetical protein